MYYSKILIARFNNKISLSFQKDFYEKKHPYFIDFVTFKNVAFWSFRAKVQRFFMVLIA
jgi:hypothetical protein